MCKCTVTVIASADSAWSFSLSHQKNHETVFKLQFRWRITATQPLMTQANQSKMKPSVVSIYMIISSSDFVGHSLCGAMFLLITKHMKYISCYERCLNYRNTNHACHNVKFAGKAKMHNYIGLIVGKDDSGDFLPKGKWRSISQ